MFRTLIVAALAVSTLAFAQHPAEAARKRISESAGQRCNAGSAPAGLWLGWYSATVEGPFVSFESSTPISRQRCFTTQEECLDWLYTMQAIYSDNWRVKRCTKRG
ncbi:MAG TPA: hypothetical protein PKE65_05405 [Rhizobiaceae bacterium]|nr:hypothetical protein [Rhizobiaceae bacterium]